MYARLKKLSREKKNEEEAPVVGQYRKVEFDLWEAWNEFSYEMGALAGNVIRGRDGGKEYKAGFARAWAFAVQFWLKIKASFPETWDKIDAKELLKIKSKFPNEEQLNAFLSNHMTLTEGYRNVMTALEYGVLKEKGGFERYKPNYQDLCIVSDFMAAFIHESGIGDIEFRFVNEEQGSAF